eukprot:COSAG01_NODE_275_length_19669_cov_8.676188_10_plen_262_part_00
MDLYPQEAPTHQATVEDALGGNDVAGGTTEALCQVAALAEPDRAIHDDELERAVEMQGECWQLGTNCCCRRRGGCGGGGGSCQCGRPCRLGSFGAPHPVAARHTEVHTQHEVAVQHQKAFLPHHIDAQEHALPQLPQLRAAQAAARADSTRDTPPSAGGADRLRLEVALRALHHPALRGVGRDQVLLAHRGPPPSRHQVLLETASASAGWFNIPGEWTWIPDYRRFTTSKMYCRLTIAGVRHSMRSYLVPRYVHQTPPTAG